MYRAEEEKAYLEYVERSGKYTRSCLGSKPSEPDMTRISAEDGAIEIVAIRLIYQKVALFSRKMFEVELNEVIERRKQGLARFVIFVCSPRLARDLEITIEDLDFDAIRIEITKEKGEARTIHLNKLKAEKVE